MASTNPSPLKQRTPIRPSLFAAPAKRSRTPISVEVPTEDDDVPASKRPRIDSGSARSNSGAVTGSKTARQAKSEDETEDETEDEHVHHQKGTSPEQAAVKLRQDRVPVLSRELVRQARLPEGLLPTLLLLQAVTGEEKLDDIAKEWPSIKTSLSREVWLGESDGKTMVRSNQAKLFLQSVAKRSLQRKGVRHQVHMALQDKWDDIVFEIVAAEETQQKTTTTTTMTATATATVSSTASATATRTATPTTMRTATPTTTPTAMRTATPTATGMTTPTIATATAAAGAAPAPTVTSSSITAQRTSPVPFLSAQASSSTATPQEYMRTSSQPVRGPSVATTTATFPTATAGTTTRNDEHLKLINTARDYVRPILLARSQGASHLEHTWRLCAMSRFLFFHITAAAPEARHGTRQPQWGIIGATCQMLGLFDPDHVTREVPADYDPVTHHVDQLRKALGLKELDTPLHKLSRVLRHISERTTPPPTAELPELSYARDALALLHSQPASGVLPLFASTVMEPLACCRQQTVANSQPRWQLPATRLALYVLNSTNFLATTLQNRADNAEQDA